MSYTANDVREAVREAKQRSCMHGGWWTVYTNQQGQFTRSPRDRPVDGWTPLMHVLMVMVPDRKAPTGWRFDYKLERGAASRRRRSRETA